MEEGKEKTGEATPEEEYDKAWEEADKGAKEAPGKAEPSSEEEGAKKEPETEPIKTPEPAPRSEEFGTVESMAKAVKDTQRYAAGLKQEVDRLHAQITAQEKGTATQEDVDKARKAVSDARDGYDSVRERVYDDYPELKDLIDPILETNRALKEKVDSQEQKFLSQEEKRVEDAKRAEADGFRLRFEEIVKPAVEKAHPGFEKLLFVTNDVGVRGMSPEYREWAETQAPGLRTAALFSDDPNDISYAVGQYKKHRAVAGGVTTTLKDKQEAQKAAILESARTMRGGYAPPMAPSGDDEDSYSAGWKDAGKQLKSQGVT